MANDKKTRAKIKEELVREFLDYDPETGVLTWRVRDRKWFATDQARNIWNARYAGTPAGRADCLGGYIRVAVLDRKYLAHRLIWLWMTGEWPEHQIDHINHTRSDNRWSNLREATRVENMRNTSLRADNTSGVVGVCWHRQCSQWQARVWVGGRGISLGLFTDKNAAIAARKAAEREHGYHENHGRAA